jgi:molybdate transport system substrate-binding protein
VRLALAAVSAAVLLAGCGGSEESSAPVVFAASSLSDVAPAVDPEATVVVGGSNDLAAQIRDGADADVFLSASATPVEELREAGLLAEAVAFASNQLVLVVAKEVDAGRIEDLSDLRGDGITLVLGAEGVPIGNYARELLAQAGLADQVNVVSLEEDVKGVLGKVALGEADAGIVYATDARAAGGDVRPVAIPAELQPEVRYYAAAVDPPSEEARAYLDRLLGPEGEDALRAAGFLPAP